jgi:UDP-N-acetylglucosamine 2-epimerase (non-hydrolysing)
MIKVLTIFGTRPEAIKLAPIIKELEKQSDKFVSRVCITGQHREMVDPFLKLFNIKPDWNLNIMKPNQTLFDITLSILSNINIVLEQESQI